MRHDNRGSSARLCRENLAYQLAEAIRTEGVHRFRTQTVTVQERGVARPRENSENGFLKLPGSIGIDQHTNPSVEERVAGTLKAACDHGRPAGHRLDEN